MRRLLLLLVILLAAARLTAQTSRLPRRIYVENTEKSSHVQGIAIDTLRGCAYFSFTTSLIKTDLQGRVLGSVTGLTCHLGCLDLDEQTGRVYASVEYKNDEIGRGIMRIMGKQLGQRDNTFYIGIFDGDKINRVGIDAQSGGVMRTVFLPQVARFYEDTVVNQGRRVAHRYGCSGIDAIALGPQMGSADGPARLYIDVAVYGDTTRTDNDYQMLLEYDLKTLDRYARPLDQSRPHRVGPKRARRQLFVFTGNTSYGVQNLEYDPTHRWWWMAVYRGSKSRYPNYPLFTVDGTVKPRKQRLQGFDRKEKGLVLTLAAAGARHPATGLRGWRQKAGQTGMHALGNNLFYLAQGSRTPEGIQTCEVRLYRFTGQPREPFVPVE